MYTGMAFRPAGFVVMCGLVFCGASHGQTIPIQNPSFETPALSDGLNQGIDAPLLVGSNSGVVGNWTITMSTLVGVSAIVPARGQIENPAGAGPGGIDGVQIGRLTSSGVAGVATNGTFYQDLGVSFTANTRYTLTASVGLANIAQAPSSFGFSLMAGNTAVASTSQASLLSLLVTSNQLFQASITFQTGATPPTGDVGVQFFQGNLAGVAGSMIFDNASLAAVGVPEPSTYALLGGTLVVGAWAGRRYRRRKALVAEAILAAE